MSFRVNLGETGPFEQRSYRVRGNRKDLLLPVRILRSGKMASCGIAKDPDKLRFPVGDRNRLLERSDRGCAVGSKVVGKKAVVPWVGFESLDCEPAPGHDDRVQAKIGAYIEHAEV